MNPQRHEMSLSGDLDLQNVHEVEERALGILDDPAVETLALDLRDVSFIDSTGIGTLVRIRLAAEKADKALVLVAPSDPVVRVLRITALIDVFDVQP